MKQLRLDFSDYPAKEQERDAMKSRFKQVYLMRINGEWVHYTIIDGKEDYDNHTGDLTETYYEIKARFKEHTVKVIQNKGLENYLIDMLPKKQQRQINIRQLNIFER